MIYIPQDDRSEQIKNLYRHHLNREADEAGLNQWYQSELSIDEIEGLIKKSREYKLKAFAFSERSKNVKKMTGRNISIDTVQPIHNIVEQAFHITAKEWRGSLNIYMPGKTGEILFLLGYIKPLREMIPKAKIVLHTIPFYIPVIQNVVDRPDHLEPIEVITSNLADSVNAAVFSNPIEGFEIRGMDLWVSPFRNWQKYSLGQASNPGPFYRAFANAIGVIPNYFEKPKWIPLQKLQKKWIPFRKHQQRKRIALALPTSNYNASIRQILPFSASQWENLAQTLKERGLTPLATGHKDDPPSPSMPGWTWEKCNIVETVTMILDAEYLITYSTGLAFAAASFGKGQIVMMDELNEKYTWLRFGLGSISDVIDISRTWAIFTPPDGIKDLQAYELALEVASNLYSSKGYTIGYTPE